MCRAGTIRVVGISAALALLAACTGGAGGGGSRDGGGAVAAATFSKSFGGPLHDSASAAIQARDGGYVFAGQFGGPYEPHNGQVYGDLWLNKLDARGDVQWQRVLELPDSAIAKFRAARRAADGGYLVAGETVNDNRQQLTVTKFAASGLVEWERRFDSGTWTNFPFAGAAFGRGAYTADTAVDLWPLPDGGALVTGVSLGNLLVNRRDDGEFVPVSPGGGGTPFIDAKSVIVIRVGADGSLIWKRRLTEGQFTSGDQHALIARIRATVDQGAVLAYPIHDLDHRKLRIVRLGQGGEILWQSEEDGISISDLEQTVDEGFIVTTGMEPFTYDRNLPRDTNAPQSRVLKFDSAGNTQWRRKLRSVDLAAVTQVCESVDPGNAVTCRYVVSGTLCRSAPQDSWYADLGPCYEQLAYLQQLDAGGGEILDEAATTNSSFRRIVDVSSFQDGQYIAAIGRAEKQQGTEYRRIVLDASTQEWLVSGAGFPGFANVATVSLAAPDQVLVLSDFFATRYSVPEPLSNQIVEEEGIGYGSSGLWGRVVGIVEVANDSYIVVVGIDQSVAAVRVTSGQIDWQRRVNDGGWDNGSSWHIEAMGVTASGDGGVVIAGRIWDRATTVVKLTGAGEVAWATEELDAPDALDGRNEESIDIVDLQRLPGGGYVALGTVDRNPGYEVDRLSILFRIDDAGHVTSRSRYGLTVEGELEPASPRLLELEAETLAIAPDGGFVLASAKHLPEDGLATVWKTDDDGAILWTRRLALRGAKARAARIHAAPDGGYLLGLTEQGAISPDALGVPHGQNNILLVKLDAQGNPVWTRSYGAFLDESLNDLRVLDDGGLLIAGRSNSLGENSEAWLLRLDADGNLAAGCNAHLGSLPAAALLSSAAPVRRASRIETATGPATLRTISVEDRHTVAVIPDATVARQCFGSTPVSDPAPQPGFMLTLTQPGTLTGVVVSTPAGVVCGTAASPPPCSASFPADSDVFLTYELASAQDFLRFEDCDEIIPDASGPASCRVRMTRDRTVRAIFGEPRDRFRLRMTVNGVGTVRSGDEDGISCGQYYGDDQDCEHFYEPFLAGTTLPTTITLSVFTHAEGFLGWGGDCAAFGAVSGFNLVMDSDKHCSANFAQPPGSFDLTVQRTGVGTGSVVSAPGGISCGDTCTASFAPDQTVRLLATEGINSSFARWTGCDRLAPPPSGSIAICEVDMTRARGVEAEFDYAVGGQYLLEFVVTGADGIVESSDHAIICSSAGPDCQEHYLPGVSVSIGYNLLRGGGTFLGWGGDCANFGFAGSNNLVMNGDKHCTAQFSSPPPTQFTLNIVKVGPTSTVRSVPAGIDCGPTCNAPFNAGQRVLLEVIPGTGFNFNGWSGCTRQPPGANFWPDCEVEMTSNRTVQVNIE